jgi:hypothetical protein
VPTSGAELRVTADDRSCLTLVVSGEPAW